MRASGIRRFAQGSRSGRPTQGLQLKASPIRSQGPPDQKIGREIGLGVRSMSKGPGQVPVQSRVARREPCGRDAGRAPAGRARCPSRADLAAGQTVGMASKLRDPPEQPFPRRFGKYKLLRELAQGGMGAVYLAASGARGMEKVCALKVVLPSLATPEYIGRFMDEAKVMVRLSHGNLVQVFDVGEVDDEAYIAMEYVDGQDIRSIWNRCVEVRRAFPVDVAVHMLKDACRGLSYAHTYEGLHLVHRDISPPNIMVNFAGESKVMDFGLAHSAIKVEHTSPGLVFGKVPYMSPEQARGDLLDGRTDVFAVGVVLWELLTGRRLFPSQGDQASDIAARARDPEIPSSREFTRRVPPALDELVLRALAVDPDERFQSAAEMSAALGRFLSTNWPGTDSHRVGSFVTDLFGACSAPSDARYRARTSRRMGSAVSYAPCASCSVAMLLSEVTVLSCSGPSAVSRIVSAMRKCDSASARRPRSCSISPRLLCAVATAGWLEPSRSCRSCTFSAIITAAVSTLPCR